MRKYSTDVDSGTIIMDGGNEPVLVATNVENRFVIHLIGAGESRAQLGEIGKAAALYYAVPVFQETLRVGMLPRKYIEAFTGDDVHEDLRP